MAGRRLTRELLLRLDADFYARLERLALTDMRDPHQQAQWLLLRAIEAAEAERTAREDALPLAAGQ